ncbi:MAG: hypothetical protein IJZ64_05610 [Ruminococcus sp.]|nr:hypothetical protein [Ruminococcus sp.]
MNEINTTNSSDFLIHDNIAVTVRSSPSWKRNIILTILALIGYIGTITTTLSMFKPVYNGFTLFVTSAFSFILLCILVQLPGKHARISFLFLVAEAIFIFLFKYQILSGFKFFYNHFYCSIHNTDTLYYKSDLIYDEAFATTYFLIAFISLFAFLICWFTLKKPHFILGFLITFMPIEIGLYNGVEMNLFSIMLVIIYWTCILTVHLADSNHGKNQKSFGFLRKENGFIAAYPLRAPIATLCCIVTSIMTVLAICISWGTIQLTNMQDSENIKEKRNNIKQSIENFDVQQTMDNISEFFKTGNSMRTQKLGNKSKMDIKNKEQLNITVDKLPTSSVYLKDFTGTVYENNSWSAISDDVWKNESNLCSLITEYGCAPQVYPYLFNEVMFDSSNITMQIKPVNTERRCYVPYASFSSRAEYEFDYKTKMPNNQSYTFTVSDNINYNKLLENDISYSYLSRDVFNFEDANTKHFFNLLSLSDEFSELDFYGYYVPESSQNNKALQAIITEQYKYRDFVYDNYTDSIQTPAMQEVYDSLPEELKYNSLNNSDSFNNSNETLDEQLEILNEIQSYLADSATYSLSPGKTPGTRDFVNYFLIENKKGYCTHFATAGILLARNAGIPARYCEGYVIAPEDIENAKRNANGSYTISITDARAHAWCEFYITGYGWMPFEFTPGYYGFENLDIPQEDESSVEEKSEEETTQITTTEIQTETILNTTTSVSISDESINNATNNSDKDKGKNTNTNSEKRNNITKYVVIILIITAIIAIFPLVRTYKLKTRKQKFYDNNKIDAIFEIYKYMQSILAFINITPGNQQLMDFAETAGKKLEPYGGSPEIIKSLFALATAADMGNKEPSQAEIQEAIKITEQIAESIYQSKNILQKLYMKYIYHIL